MLENIGCKYNLLLGGDIRPEELRMRRRRMYLYALLSTNGKPKDLQDMMSPVPVQWQRLTNLIHRIVTMLWHGEQNVQRYV